MKKSSFCSFPFDTVFLGADGLVKTCCSARDTIGDLNKQSIEEIVNGERAKEIRRGIISGNWDMKNCSQCYELESVGAFTERLARIGNFEDMKNFTEDNFVLQHIDLRWSNTCNLACNYCYEYFSSIWAKILNKYMDPLKDSTDLLSYIEHNNDTVKYVNLLGGEPLLQKENHKLFELLDKNVEGYILTNLSVPIETNKIATKIIEEFPNISWGVSFDNVGKRFEYVRHRADWDLLVHNIDYVSHRVKEFSIHPLYNIYTAFNLVELYEFLETKKINDIYWCAIINPKHFSVFDLPLKMRKQAHKEISRVLDRWGDRFETTRLLDIQKDLLIEKPQKNYKFLQYTNKLETKLHPEKKYTFAELWPDLYKRLQKFENGVNI